MEKENQWLLQPLIPPLTTSISTPSSRPPAGQDEAIVNPAITVRLLSVFIIAFISLWANYEASKFFDITIVNECSDRPSGKLFDLMYVANDKAVNMILEASQSVRYILHSENHQTRAKDRISRVTLKVITGKNLTDTVVVDRGQGEDREFTITISSSVVEAKDVNAALAAALLRGMARIWLWDAKLSKLGSPALVDAMVEYVAVLASSSGRTESSSGDLRLRSAYDSSGRVWWEGRNPNIRAVAHILDNCEKKGEGFIKRLVDHIMMDRQREGTEVLESCNILMMLENVNRTYELSSSV